MHRFITLSATGDDHKNLQKDLRGQIYLPDISKKSMRREKIVGSFFAAGYLNGHEPHFQSSGTDFSSEE